MSNTTIGECSGTPTAPTTTDACKGIITGTTTTLFPITTQGTTVVTWTFDDGNGNSTTANQNVILDDITAPVTPVLSNVIRECSSTPAAPTTTDACKGIITGATTTLFPITTLGTTIVTWTFDDGNGNTTTANQNITITSPDASFTLIGSTLIANNTTASAYQWIDCDNNNTPISGQTNQTYSPGLSGNYALSVTGVGCTAISNCENVVITELLNGIIKTINISVYPNPSNGFITINSQTEGDYSIVNELGQTIISFHIKPDNPITIDNLNYGMYFIIGSNNTQQIKEKLIISK